MTKVLPYQDYTLKAKVTDPGKIEKKLEEMKARFVGVDNQKDTYFNIHNGKLKLRQGTIENLITHYERIDENGTEKTIVYRYDLNPAPEQISKLHREHAVIGVVEKERKIYYIDNVKIHLDRTPKSMIFIEIEAIDRDNSMSSEKLRLQCLSIKEMLGVKDSELMRTGYLSNDDASGRQSQ